MKRLLRKLLLVSCLFSAIANLGSCAISRNYQGQIVSADQRIDIKTSTDFAVWETNDVTIRYKTIDDGGSSFTISGTIQIADSVVYTFPNPRFFNLYVYLLDKNGAVTNRYDISPILSAISSHSERQQFSRRLPKGSDITSIAFGYWGVFNEHPSLSRRRGDSWEIQSNPFQ